MKRFSISGHGIPLLQFEYEHHIKDSENEDALIIVRSGFSTKEENEIIVHKILSILNENRRHIKAGN